MRLHCMNGLVVLHIELSSIDGKRSLNTEFNRCTRRYSRETQTVQCSAERPVYEYRCNYSIRTHTVHSGVNLRLHYGLVRRQ